MIEQRFRNIVLAEERNDYTAETVGTWASPDELPAYVLDFPLNIDDGKEFRVGDELLGFRTFDGMINNVDHHAPMPRMMRFISTAPLVKSLLTVHPEVVSAGGLIVLNHVDTDSILSAGMMAGLLDPSDQRLTEAAIAADHTGVENRFADTLNGIEHLRDLTFSLDVAQRLQRDEALPAVAHQAMMDRRTLRVEVQKFVDEGKLVNVSAGVRFAEIPTDMKMRSEFFPAADPDASAFVLAQLMDNGNWGIKVRGGMKLPAGVYLNQLDLPMFGGRWNAGGTIRSGGWEGQDPREYATLVAKRIG